MNSCFDCGFPLTDKDIELKEVRCLECEEILIARIEYYNQGGKDLQLDALFNSQGAVH